MAAIICHGCGRAFDPPAGYTRNKIQCPGCGVICAVPAGAKRESAPAKRQPQGEDDWLKDAPQLAPREEEPIEDVEIVSPAPTMELDDDDEPDPVELVHPDGEDDDSPYDLRDKIGPRCPKCRTELKPDTVLCLQCGFNRRTKQKVKRTYQPVDRTWDSDYTLATRLLLMAAAQGFHLLLGVIVYSFFGTFMPMIVTWVPLTGLLCFLLGTYDQIHLQRDKKGRVTLTKRWRFAFVPLTPESVDVRGYEGVVSGPWRDVGMLEWYVLFSLLTWGVIPGLIWYYAAIHCPHFMVALAEDHGRASFFIYRGQNMDQMNEIADAVSEAAGLQRLG